MGRTQIEVYGGDGPAGPYRRLEDATDYLAGMRETYNAHGPGYAQRIRDLAILSLAQSDITEHQARRCGLVESQMNLADEMATAAGAINEATDRMRCTTDDEERERVRAALHDCHERISEDGDWWSLAQIVRDTLSDVAHAE